MKLKKGGWIMSSHGNSFNNNPELSNVLQVEPCSSVCWTWMLLMDCITSPNVLFYNSILMQKLWSYYNWISSLSVNVCISFPTCWKWHRAIVQCLECWYLFTIGLVVWSWRIYCPVMSSTLSIHSDTLQILIVWLY